MSRLPRTTHLFFAGVVAAGLGLGFGSFVLHGFSHDAVIRVLQAASVFGFGLAMIAAGVALAVVRLGGWRQGEAEFEQIVKRSERLADDDDEDGWQEGWLEADDFDVVSDADSFAEVLRQAINELPSEYHAALEHIDLVVIDSYAEDAERLRRISLRGGRYTAYDAQTLADDVFGERVLVFRDLLIRDFGHDPDQLQQRLHRLLRRELGRRLRPGLRRG